MRVVPVVAVLVCLCSPTALMARQQHAPAGKPLDPDKKICKRQTPVGSMIPSKPVCRTRAEWAAIAADGNRAARDMSDQARSAAPPQ